jgi:beta-phosphoglucomutase-like phosphatase (HAD superfamily)
MLLALLLDLGETLVHAGRVIEEVPEALKALRSLRTVQGIPLSLALVSDYTMPAPGAPAGEVTRLFDEYVGLVRDFGLLPYFEPPERHITLSTQAGVRKPAQAIFELALRRLGLPHDLRTAMFITEDAAHVAAARNLGITAWQYGVEFRFWRDGPPLVARALADDTAALEKAGGVSAEMTYRKALEDNRQLAEPDRSLGPGETHTIEKGPDGNPRVTRKRFSIT